jgi:4,5:9,10-diseco-3-hydroxy-5,9,17-trioxoandrosta-1(10),2-diene-4-oate hydrolase
MLSTATEKMVSVDGLRLRCWDEGSGPPVILIHGIGASLEYWLYTVPALAQHHRVVAVDLPGCGFSERGPKLPTLEEVADLIVDLQDALGFERASLIGNSLGGLVALETALRHPDRIDRLILSNSAGLGREINFFWRLTAIRPVGRFMIEANRLAARRGWRNLFYNPRGEPDIVARCEKWVARPDLVDTIVGAAKSGLTLRGQRPDVIRLNRLRGLRVPTLIVWGREDWVIPVAHAERAYRLIPNARLEIFENCGHCPHLERPLDFNRLAEEFLATPPSE